jgi:hypothetical protein
MMGATSRRQASNRRGWFHRLDRLAAPGSWEIEVETTGDGHLVNIACAVLLSSMLLTGAAVAQTPYGQTVDCRRRNGIPKASGTAGITTFCRRSIASTTRSCVRRRSKVTSHP